MYQKEGQLQNKSVQYVSINNTNKSKYYLMRFYLWLMALHIGKKIKEELYKQGVSVSAFAKKINKSRNVVYDIFERESVDTELLQKIGEILKFNFFSFYGQSKKPDTSGTAEEITTYHKSSEYLKLLEQKNNALEKEVQYLKKIIALLESEKPETKRKKGK